MNPAYQTDMSTAPSAGSVRGFGYNFSAKFIGNEHETVAAICQSAGASGIELWPWWPGSITAQSSPTEVENITAIYADAGVATNNYHIPYCEEWDVSHADERRRGAIVEKLLALFEKLALLGDCNAIIHPDVNDDYSYSAHEDLCFRQLGRSLEVLLPAIEGTGIVLALENMPPAGTDGRCTAQPRFMQRVAETFVHPQLGFCLDTGHACVARGPAGTAAWFDALSDRLVTFHIHDNAGDRDAHLAPGHGTVDWNIFFDRVQSLGFSGNMTIEAPPYGSVSTQDASRWQRLLAATDNLANAARIS